MKNIFKHYLFPTFFIFAALFVSFGSAAQGSWQWAVGSSATTHGSLYDVVSATNDKSGNIFVSALIENTAGIADSITLGPAKLPVSIITEMAITKADSSGHLLWSIKTTNDQYSGPNVIGMATDDSGNLYLLGGQEGRCLLGAFTLDSLSSTFGDYSLFLAKISPGGTVLWAENICEESSGIEDFGGAGGFVGVDGAGYVYVSACFSDSAVTIGTTTLINHDPTGMTNDVFLAKYNPLGHAVWATSFGGNNHDAPGTGLVTREGTIYLSAASNSDSLVIGGATLYASSTFFGWIGAYFVYTGILAKYDSSGNVDWAKNLGPNTAILGMTVDTSEKICAEGIVKTTIAFGPDTVYDLSGTGQMLFVAGYDTSGNPLWGNGVTIVNPTSLGTNSIVVDACENVWVCAGIASTYGISGHALSIPPGYTDAMFAAEYSAGVYITSMALSSGGEDGSNIIGDDRGNFYICADYEGTAMTFGADILGTPEDEQLFIAKYRYDTSCLPPQNDLEQVQSLKPTGNTVTIYPNPVNSMLTVIAPYRISSIVISNIFGQVVITHPYESEQVQIDVHDLQAGMYFIKINDTEVRKFVKQ